MDGDMVAAEAPDEERQQYNPKDPKKKLKKEARTSQWTYNGLKKRLGHWRDERAQKRKENQMSDRKSEPARAYQFGNTILVENEDGDIINKYELPPQKSQHRLLGEEKRWTASTEPNEREYEALRPGTKVKVVAQAIASPSKAHNISQQKIQDEAGSSALDHSSHGLEDKELPGSGDSDYRGSNDPGGSYIEVIHDFIPGPIPDPNKKDSDLENPPKTRAPKMAPGYIPPADVGYPLKRVAQRPIQSTSRKGSCHMMEPESSEQVEGIFEFRHHDSNTEMTDSSDSDDSQFSERLPRRFVQFHGPDEESFNDEGNHPIFTPSSIKSHDLESDASIDADSSDADPSSSALETSCKQSTDPSTWLDGSSADQIVNGCPLLKPNGGDLPMPLEMLDDEIQSIASVPGSIGSTDSGGGGSLGQAGINYLVAKFTQSDPELLELYTEASQKLSKARFVENNRRLLKTFYLEICCEDHHLTASHKEAVAFLKSRRRRAAISLDILRTIVPDSEVAPTLEERTKEFSMLNEYLRTLDAADGDIADDQNSLETDDSNESDVEDDEERSMWRLTSLQATGEYFVTSRAFALYKQRLHKFLHPEHVRNPEPADGRNAVHHQEGGNGFMRVLKPEKSEHTSNSDTDRWLLDDDQDQVQGETTHLEERLVENSPDDIPQYSIAEQAPKEPCSTHPKSDGSDKPFARDSFATWLAKWLTDKLWPPREGQQRIWYLCGCGQHTYIDVRELESGGVESEWQMITRSAAAIRRQTHPSQSSASSGGGPLLTPPAAHLSSTMTSICTPTLPPSSPRATISTTSSPGLSSINSSFSSRGPQSEPLYLLVCINGRAYRTLAELRHLDVYNCWNDELLMRGILEQYEQASKERHWTIAMLIPTPLAVLAKWLRGSWESIPTPVRKPPFLLNWSLALSLSDWWHKWTPHISFWAPLYIIDTADFVEFELVPHPEGKDAFPDYFTSGCWPSPDNRQYRYKPVPMKCTKTINLWHTRQPGPHTEFYWHNTVPKKLDGRLHRPPGTTQDVVGYGVRINERLNDVLIFWWSFVVILLTGLFILVYSMCTGDNSSAFGLGAYLVAAFTVYVQLQYAWWKRI